MAKGLLKGYNAVKNIWNKNFFHQICSVSTLLTFIQQFLDRSIGSNINLFTLWYGN